MSGIGKIGQINLEQLRRLMDSNKAGVMLENMGINPRFGDSDKVRQIMRQLTPETDKFVKSSTPATPKELSQLKQRNETLHALYEKLVDEVGFAIANGMI